MDPEFRRFVDSAAELYEDAGRDVLGIYSAFEK
jgi:hypothetical protein